MIKQAKRKNIPMEEKETYKRLARTNPKKNREPPIMNSRKRNRHMKSALGSLAEALRSQMKQTLYDTRIRNYTRPYTTMALNLTLQERESRREDRREKAELGRVSLQNLPKEMTCAATGKWETERTS